MPFKQHSLINLGVKLEGCTLLQFEFLGDITPIKSSYDTQDLTRRLLYKTTIILLRTNKYSHLQTTFSQGLTPSLMYACIKLKAIATLNFFKTESKLVRQQGT